MDTVSIEELESILEEENIDLLKSRFELLNPADVAWVLSHWDEDTRHNFLQKLTPEEAAEMMEELSPKQAAELIEDLPHPHVADIIEEMSSNLQVDLLGHLDQEDAESILQEIEPEEAYEIRQLMRYPADTAGGLMITEYLSYSETLKISDVLNDMRDNAELYSDYDVQYAYVVSADQQLKGVLRLRDLVLSPQRQEIRQVMLKSPLFVSVTDTLNNLEHFFDQHAFFGAPVVDEQGQLVGVLRRSDVEHAVQEGMSNLFLRFSGIMGGEESRSLPLVSRSSRRLAVLSVNILLNMLAASVIAMYQDTLTQVIALAVFLPVVSDMSGCSGNQAVAVTIRELSLGLVRPQELLRTLLKEMGVGIVNGLVLGGLLGTVAFFWKGNIYLGLVVGGALALNTLVAVSLGGIIPLLLKRLNIDPAIASSPVLTTATDMCGFFFVLSLASLMLSYLV